MRQMEVALIENLQRSDLNPVEEARGIKALIEECALTQEQAAARLGKSRSTVTNTLRLLLLDDSTLELLENGLLSEGHARALLGIEDRAVLERTAADVAKRRLSVRQTEELVRAIKRDPAQSERPSDVRAPEIDIMEGAFRKALGSYVKVSGSPGYGKISIQYKSFDEFERIYNIISRLVEE